MNIQSIKDAGDIRGKRVITRLDLNVPIQDGKVVDDLRIQKSLETLNYLKNAGAKTIILAHLEGKGGATLAPVAEYLNTIFSVTFVKDFLNKESTMTVIDSMKDGDIVLFENLRVSEGEKKNDPSFALYLSQFGDLYVNDAFSVSHRAHASVVALPALLPHYAGFNLLEEINHIKAVFHPERPFLFILGGAKFETKMPLIKKFMTLADHVFVGGALANNFFKEKGLNVGASLVSEGNYNLVEYLNDRKLILSTDVVVKSPNGVVVKKVAEIADEDCIVDVGPQSVEDLKPVIASAKFVLWNGPMGNYEEGFKDQTEAIAKIIAETGVQSAIGGGDTTATLAALALDKDKNIFISTGGGAMLQYLLDETLPGIEALK